MKTNWFIVALSGATVDGRKISREQITQMAASYDPKKFGGRVWLEHYRSILPDGPFKALGDILALKAEEHSSGELALYAQIEALPDLVKLNEQKQKIYWSIEMDPNFQGGGSAYCVGLACTDTPASTGTEVLKFTLTNPDVKLPAKAHLFSNYVEGNKLEAAGAETPDLATRLKALFSRGDKRTDDVSQALEVVANEVAALNARFGTFASAAPSSADISALRKELDDLKLKFTDSSPTQKRPPTDGNTTATDSDC